MSKKQTREKVDLFSDFNDDKEVIDNIVDNLLKHGKEVKKIDIINLVDAPLEWNFFPPIDENKMEEMIHSIAHKGLLNPIIVWERDNNKFMILAGHNRVQAFNRLYEITQDSKYKSIDAIIYRKNDISDKKAQGIIIDTNYVQRKYTIETTTKSILKKYDELKEEEFKGDVYKKIAETLDKSKSSIIEHKNLMTKIIDDIKRLVYDEEISLKAIQKIVNMPQKKQQWLFDNFEDKLNSKTVSKLKHDMTEQEIEDILNPKEDNITDKKVTLFIPENLVEEFKIMAEQWIKSKA